MQESSTSQNREACYTTVILVNVIHASSKSMQLLGLTYDIEAEMPTFVHIISANTHASKGIPEISYKHEVH